MVSILQKFLELSKAFLEEDCAVRPVPTVEEGLRANNNDVLMASRGPHREGNQVKSQLSR